MDTARVEERESEEGMHVCKRVTGCFLLQQCIRVVMVNMERAPHG